MITSFDKFRRHARKNMHKNDDRCRYIHFSYIMKRNRIVVWGINKAWVTHPLAARYNYRFDTIHSEIDALSKLKRQRLKDEYDLVNIRLNQSGEVRLSRPCKICRTVLSQFNIKDIYYSTNHNDFMMEASHVG